MSRDVDIINFDSNQMRLSILWNSVAKPPQPPTPPPPLNVSMKDSLVTREIVILC